ncbi:MAG: LUD domain-containing protein [Acetobacteraceae bacterium]|nr:LUD domain-containing protein [Acetobacteraceae bacterium]
MSGAREAILGSVRRATERMPTGVVELPGYRRALGLDPAALLDRFAERLKDYDVTVLRVPEAQIATTASARIAERGIRTLLIPPEFPEAWRPSGPTLVPDSGQGARELNEIGGVMAGCCVGIAESGTIVLDAGPGQGRRALTLLPDYFLCVVLARQVVGLLPEAMPRLRPAIDAGRPLTFVSGPSATADIELNRVRGVHGPRTLDVILAG